MFCIGTIVRGVVQDVRSMRHEASSAAYFPTVPGRWNRAHVFFFVVLCLTLFCSTFAVLTLFRTIKSVVAGQAPVVLE